MSKKRKNKKGVQNISCFLTRDLNNSKSQTVVSRNEKPPLNTRCERTFAFEVREIDEENRKVHVSFSSEKPVERWFGSEILCHDVSAVQLDRIRELGASLFNHNRDILVGIPENVVLNEAERRCHADIIFDDDEESERIFRKVKKGFLRGISVGYSVECWEEVKAGTTSSNGRFAGPAYVATKWTPLEISFVTVPADTDVGVNREVEKFTNIEKVHRTERELTMNLQELCRQLGLNFDDLTAKGFTEAEIRSMCSKIQQRAEEAADEEEAEKKKKEKDENEKSAAIASARTEEMQRATEIVSMCRDFGIDSADYIKEGKSVDEVRSIILNKVKTERAALAAGNVQIIGEAEADKIRVAATDGLLLRAGLISEDKANESANQFRSLSMRDLAVECLSRSGVSNAHRLSDDELFKRAVTPDSQFVSIVDNTVKKSMATAYNAAVPTFDKWCGIGSNSDFKEANHYQLSEAGDLLPLTQTGEIKFDEMKDSKVSKKVLTYARGFGFTRQALINDDLSILTKIPAAYVRAALRGRNKLVYKTLAGNENIYDGKKLFVADHNNIGTAGKLSIATLAELTKLMRKQKNLRGKETLNIKPDFLIVPAALEAEAAQLLASTADPAANNSGVANIYRNSLNLIVDAELDDYSEKSYYVAANSADIDTIEVTYLNGNQQPVLESQVGFDFVGIRWRILDDFGVTALDYRGLAKNAGQ